MAEREPQKNEEEIIPAPVQEDIELRDQTEMPDDFEEPEGKSGKWGEPVKGEVVVEGKKVEVSYREKVIELSKHRQQETGIQRIRRRELLPPFPEGLVMSSDMMDNEIKSIEADGTAVKKKVPFFSTADKFDDVYRFLTDSAYPADRAWVHAIEIGLSTSRAKNIETARRVKKFKEEGIYFQNIKSDVWCSTGVFWGWSEGFATPIFVFSNKNKMLNQYIDSVLSDPMAREEIGEASEEDFNLVTLDSPEYSKIFSKRKYSEGEGYKEYCRKNGIAILKRNLNVSNGVNTLKILRDGVPITKDTEMIIPYVERKDAALRWCHAECALVPTKRSLNVLFFETNDESKKSTL